MYRRKREERKLLLDGTCLFTNSSSEVRFIPLINTPVKSFSLRNGLRLIAHVREECVEGTLPRLFMCKLTTRGRGGSFFRPPTLFYSHFAPIMAHMLGHVYLLVYTLRRLRFWPSNLGLFGRIPLRGYAQQKRGPEDRRQNDCMFSLIPGRAFLHFSHTAGLAT